MFKIGDKVKVVNWFLALEHDRTPFVGVKGTIYKIENKYDHPYYVRTNTGDDLDSFFEEELELLPAIGQQLLFGFMYDV